MIALRQAILESVGRTHSMNPWLFKYLANISSQRERVFGESTSTCGTEMKEIIPSLMTNLNLACSNTVIFIVSRNVS